MHDAIPPAARLAVTLHFLATSILHKLLCERYVDVSMIRLLFSIMFGLASSRRMQQMCEEHTHASDNMGNWWAM